jgi:hypothetical protein
VTNIDWADAFLLAVGKNLSREALPVFPGSKSSAREMVAAFSDDDTVETMSLPEQRALAKKLFRFALGYVYSERVFDRIDDEIPAAEAIGSFLRAFAPTPALEVAA